MIGPETKINDSLDHLFRHHAGQMVSVLSRIFGVRHIDLIEDSVQDALVAALRKWPHSEVPQNPRAWLTETAKNRVLDRLRRDARSSSIEETELDIPAESDAGGLRFDTEVGEDQLRMIFACCHPAIAPDSQVALTLKIVGGFSVREIARAYLANEESVAKMLTRAKQKLRSGGVPLEIPAGVELGRRLDAVLKVLYLIFNEGYSTSEGDDLIREDLCQEAIRLCEMVCAHPMTGFPKAHAAAALFLFQASRLKARTGDAGCLVLFEDQDRAKWDHAMIARGLGHFRRSAAGTELSPFHLEAEIAALYSLSDSMENVNWQRILDCYNELQRRQFSNVAELNRIVALGKLNGADRALTAIQQLNDNEGINRYYLYHVTAAHFLEQAGRTAEAKLAFDKALGLSANNAVRKFITERIERLGCGSAAHD
jgi:RNA polymerase sigma factor (sigma-70 family)